MTVNVALVDDADFDGGQLIALYGRRLRSISRASGDATVHSSRLLHGVTRMGAGVRYSLIVFFHEAGSAA